MRVVQVLPTMAYGDAIGNDVLALDHAIKNMGIDTQIYAQDIDNRLKGIRSFDEIGTLAKDDILLYHLSTGSRLNYRVRDLSKNLLIRFHNVTPPEFFKGYNWKIFRSCKEGWDGVRYLSDKADYCFADSEYNKRCLLECGYSCRIDVLPILIQFQDYEKKPSFKIRNRYANDGFVNILFTGRIAPNKKQEDVIAAFAHYQAYHNPKSRLFIVGSYGGNEKYYEQLKEYERRLKVENVIFTGHIPFDEILAYYHLADLFLCMSEHEGFCVPLVEAMYFRIPIIAYDKAAIADTLGGSGILMDDKDPVLVGEMVHRLLSDAMLKEQVLNLQTERLKDFLHEKINAEFETYLNAYMSRGKSD